MDVRTANSFPRSKNPINIAMLDFDSSKDKRGKCTALVPERSKDSAKRK